eukprot:7985654-Pyramimonas_sp.AAC.1
MPSPSLRQPDRSLLRLLPEESQQAANTQHFNRVNKDKAEETQPKPGQVRRRFLTADQSDARSVGYILTANQSDARSVGIFSWRTNRMQEAWVMLLRFTGPPVPIAARMHSTPQSVGIFSRRTNRALEASPRGGVRDVSACKRTTRD